MSRLHDLPASGRDGIRFVPKDRVFIHGKACVIAAADGSKTSFLGRTSETTRAFTKATGAELSLVVHTREGKDIVLQGICDLSAKAKLAPKTGKAPNSRSPRRNGAGPIA